VFEFLDFNSETTQINNIIMTGARTRMTDKQFLEKEIVKWIRSPERKAMIIGERYYAGDHDILRRERMVIGEGGKLEKIENLPNNRNIDNQYAKMVDQKVNYLLGKPLTFDTKNKAYSDELKQIFNKQFHRQLKSAGTDSLNGAIGWIFPYYDSTGALRFKRFPPYEILPFWADAEHTILDGFLRVYHVEAYEGVLEKIIDKVEVYDLSGIHRFILQNGSLIPDVEAPSSSYLVVIDEKGEENKWNWAKIPLIPLKYNAKEISLIARVKSLQDGINAIISDFENNIQEDPRNTILVLRNYEGTNLAEFRRNLSQYGVVKVRTIDGVAGDVDTLTVEVNSENYKAILEIFKKALIENARGYDVSELRSAGSPNEMNIKSIFNDIDLDANDMETEYQAAFEELLWFVNAHLANTGKGNFENENVDVIFNRDGVVVESQVIDDCIKVYGAGVISHRSVLAQFPWVDDVDEELKRIEEEKQKETDAMDEYAKTFGKTSSTPNDNSGGGVDGTEE